MKLTELFVIQDVFASGLGRVEVLPGGFVRFVFYVERRAFDGFLVRDTNVVAQWRSVPGMAYQIERTDSFVNPIWQPVGDPIIATHTITCWTNAIAPGAPLGYFRLGQQAP